MGWPTKEQKAAQKAAGGQAPKVEKKAGISKAAVKPKVSHKKLVIPKVPTWCVEDKELMNCKYKDAKKFFPDVTCGKVIKVYDGDTITIATRLSGVGPIYKFNIRMLGIDTPEKRTKDPEEGAAAITAGNKLREKCLEKVVTFTDVEYDKYGRILAVPYLNGKSLS